MTVIGFKLTPRGREVVCRKRSCVAAVEQFAGIATPFDAWGKACCVCKTAFPFDATILIGGRAAA